MWRRTYIFAVGLYKGDIATFEVQMPKNQLNQKNQTSRLLRDMYRKNGNSPLSGEVQGI
jgi:hypothetical protein